MNSRLRSTVEDRQNLKIGCPEQIAYRLGYIDSAALEQLAKQFSTSDDGQYLQRILTTNI